MLGLRLLRGIRRPGAAAEMRSGPLRAGLGGAPAGAQPAAPRRPNHDGDAQLQASGCIVQARGAFLPARRHTAVLVEERRPVQGRVIPQTDALECVRNRGFRCRCCPPLRDRARKILKAYKCAEAVQFP